MSGEITHAQIAVGAESAALQRVGSLADLRAQGRLIAAVSDQTLVVFEVGDCFVAIPAECPHAGGPICDGERVGTALSCPWHGYNFDLVTGACEDDTDLRLERFDVQVQGDDLFVKL